MNTPTASTPGWTDHLETTLTWFAFHFPGADKNGVSLIDHLLFAVIMPYGTKALLAVDDHPELAGAMAVVLNWCARVAALPLLTGTS